MSLPEGFKKNIISQWGQTAWDEMEKAIQQSPVTSIRLHPVKEKFVSIDGHKIPWCPFGRYLSERPVFTLDPSFHGGGYYVQEAASMFLWFVLEKLTGSDKEITVLDLCGAPGGKSSLLASYLDNQGLLVCNEVIKNRAYILKSNIEKSGYHNVIVTQNDPKDFQSIPEYFDIILVDAPCSGEGMFRKDPASVIEWSPENVELCSARQRRIIADVLPALKKDGFLLYSTCTYNDLENIDNVIWGCNELSLENIVLDIPDIFNVLKVHKKGKTGYQFAPHRNNSEGLFFSVLQKQQKHECGKIKTTKSFAKLPNKLNPVLKKYTETPTEMVYFIDPNKEIHFFPAKYFEMINVLYNTCRIIYGGINMGKLIKEDLIPNHSLALYISLSENVKKVDLPLAQSLEFLNKSLNGIPSQEKGWLLITYKNLGLGWIKNLGTRINNYLPNEAKIRMDIHQNNDFELM
jgi:16S rRNA C967 or C1407 C5-methylase (RsmB/RsmF family)/NOL1/NOP2/fmu family ribosome biogenesis protein